MCIRDRLGGEDSMFFNELRWGTWYDRKFKDHSSGQVGELNTNGLMQIWGETTYKHLSVGEQIKICLLYTSRCV